jgi:hypothetical protein
MVSILEQIASGTPVGSAPASILSQLGLGQSAASVASIANQLGLTEAQPQALSLTEQLNAGRTTQPPIVQQTIVQEVLAASANSQNSVAKQQLLTVAQNIQTQLNELIRLTASVTV